MTLFAGDEVYGDDITSGDFEPDEWTVQDVRDDLAARGYFDESEEE